MSLRSISGFIAMFYLAFVCLGSLRQQKLYNEIRNGKIEKENFLNAVKSSSSHVMDDFREAAFKPLNSYVSHHLKQSMYRSGERIGEVEKNEVTKNLRQKLQGNLIYAYDRGGFSSYEGIRRCKLGGAEMAERIYYYGFKRRYHIHSFCKNQNPLRCEIFSSMEEAANRGYYPCETCVLGLER